jgi:hypothetical protein
MREESQMKTLLALAVPALAGTLMFAGPGAAAPLSPAKAEAAPLIELAQYGGYGGGYERREEYGEPREYRREYRDDRRQWRDGDHDEWRGREYRRRMFCRMHPEECE